MVSGFGGKRGETMLTELPFTFSGNIFCSAMPFGPFDRFHKLWPLYQEQDVDLIVVLTEPGEYLFYTGRDLISFYKEQGMDVIHLQIPDHGLPPDPAGFRKAVRNVEKLGREGRSVAVHCLAGIGRTGTFTACLAREHFDFSGEESIQWVRKFIPGAMENERQERFVLQYSCEVK